MAAWPLNIYELSRPPLRRERAINWESRGGGTEGEREREREKDRGGRDPPVVAGDAGSKRGRRMRFHRPWKGTACGYCHPMGFRFRCFQPADTILLDIIARPNYTSLPWQKRKKISPLRGRMGSPPFQPSAITITRCNEDGINDTITTIMYIDRE